MHKKISWAAVLIRTGNLFVKVVTRRRLLKKMEDLVILLRLQGGRGPESLRKWLNDNAKGSRARKHKGLCLHSQGCGMLRCF